MFSCPPVLRQPLPASPLQAPSSSPCPVFTVLMPPMFHQPLPSPTCTCPLSPCAPPPLPHPLSYSSPHRIRPASPSSCHTPQCCISPRVHWEEQTRLSQVLVQLLPCHSCLSKDQIEWQGGEEGGRHVCVCVIFACAFCRYTFSCFLVTPACATSEVARKRAGSVGERMLLAVSAYASRRSSAACASVLPEG